MAVLEYIVFWNHKGQQQLSKDWNIFFFIKRSPVGVIIILTKCACDVSWSTIKYRSDAHEVKFKHFKTVMKFWACTQHFHKINYVAVSNTHFVSHFKMKFLCIYIYYKQKFLVSIGFTLGIRVCARQGNYKALCYKSLNNKSHPEDRVPDMLRYGTGFSLDWEMNLFIITPY